MLAKPCYKLLVSADHMIRIIYFPNDACVYVCVCKKNRKIVTKLLFLILFLLHILLGSFLQFQHLLIMTMDIANEDSLKRAKRKLRESSEVFDFISMYVPVY
jgi:hypothetical protein